MLLEFISMLRVLHWHCNPTTISSTFIDLAVFFDRFYVNKRVYTFPSTCTFLFSASPNFQQLQHHQKNLVTIHPMRDQKKSWLSRFCSLQNTKDAAGKVRYLHLLLSHSLSI
jgi:hypothetical protein